MFANKLFTKVAISAIALVGMASVASADSVTYSTTGVFGSNGLGSISGGGITLAFDALTNVTVAAPTFGSLGDFDINIGSGVTSSFSITDTFTLTVEQSVPTPGGSGSFGVGTVSGTVTATNSGATVIFTSPLSVSFTGTTSDTSYVLMGTPVAGHTEEEYFIVPVTTNNGVTSIQAEILSTDHAPTVPVPASLIGGSSLLGLLLVSKIRSRRNAV